MQIQEDENDQRKERSSSQVSRTTEEHLDIASETKAEDIDSKSETKSDISSETPKEQEVRESDV